jgi:hypothetical protein
MPLLNKQTNGSRAKRRDMLHLAARFDDISQVAPTEDKRSQHGAVLQNSGHTVTEGSLGNGKHSCLTPPVPALAYPSILIADLAGQTHSTSAQICERTRTKTSRSGRPRREKPDPFKHELLTQFGFQPFKKCFYGKCSTIFVPGDFKPSSPRRMFCSTQCFEAHWRQKLFRYLEKTLAQDVAESTADSATPPAMNTYATM